jgi:uncharacterized membrane protein YfcA
MHDLPLLLIAGFLAGGMNALAGGGSFLTLPALVLAGLPSVTANASSTVALFPGSLASIWVSRDGIALPGGVLPCTSIGALLATSLVGGFAGAVLLLATPSSIFDHIIPWLLLLATLALALGPRVGLALRRIVGIGGPPLLVVQFLLGIYGGYFGGAVGIMMMAVWSLLGTADLKAMNPVKTLLVAATNTVAVLCFAAAGAARWPETSVVLLAALAGGYAGARAGSRLGPRLIRAAVVSITAGMTIAFFIRAS